VDSILLWFKLTLCWTSIIIIRAFVDILYKIIKIYATYILSCDNYIAVLSHHWWKYQSSGPCWKCLSYIWAFFNSFCHFLVMWSLKSQLRKVSTLFPNAMCMCPVRELGAQGICITPLWYHDTGIILSVFFQP
jgi:hypothetical protein